MLWFFSNTSLLYRSGKLQKNKTGGPPAKATQMTRQSVYLTLLKFVLMSSFNTGVTIAAVSPGVLLGTIFFGGTFDEMFR
jgi:hypothetical protein